LKKERKKTLYFYVARVGKKKTGINMKKKTGINKKKKEQVSKKKKKSQRSSFSTPFV